MFDKLKQLNELKKMKGVLEKERQTIEREGVKVTVNGKMEVEEVILNPELDIERQASVVKACINDAMKQIQVEAAKKMFNM